MTTEVRKETGPEGLSMSSFPIDLSFYFNDFYESCSGMIEIVTQAVLESTILGADGWRGLRIARKNAAATIFRSVNW